MSSSSSSEKKLFTLICSDGETFEVEMAVAVHSETVKHLIEDVCDDGHIPLHNVTGPILSKVIEYIKKHIEPGATGNKEEDEETLRAWDTEFVKLDQQTLFDLILAANYLNIKSLLDLTCQTAANMIQRKSVDEIRKIFNIKNDFTHEEEQEFRRENQWTSD